MEIQYKICDRCGKRIIYIGWTSILRKPKRIQWTQYFNGNPSGYEYCKQEIELCAECTKALNEFMRGGENDEV